MTPNPASQLAMTAAIRRFLREKPSAFDPRDYLKPAREAAKQICKARYEQFGCAGMASKIKPLPLEGRPAGFSGAVGKFDVAGEASSAAGTTGDPLTLKIRVTGTGNFAGVSSAGLPESAVWKSYKPAVRFEPADGEIGRAHV